VLLPTSEKQFEFWKMRRSGYPNISIAARSGISRQAVSKAILTMDDKIRTVLLDMAHSSQIEEGRLNVEKGVLFGRSIPFNTNAIIFISFKHGVQVWYEHEGDCESCPRYTRCIELLWDFADELRITLEKTDDPTKMADELFAKVKEMVD
jgi:DNA-binding CsgD family transcriptional regulator